MKLTPRNALEAYVLKMIADGKPIHGFARDIWLEMVLRENPEAIGAVNSNSNT